MSIPQEIESHCRLLLSNISYDRKELIFHDADTIVHLCEKYAKEDEKENRFIQKLKKVVDELRNHVSCFLKDFTQQISIKSDLESALNEIRKVVTSETIEEGKRRDPRLDERSVNAVIQQKLIRIVIQARIYLQSMEDLYNAVRKQDLDGSKSIIGQLGNDLVFFVDCCGELMTKEEKSYVTETTDKHITKANEIFGKPDSSSSLIYEQYEKLPKNIVGIIDNIISRIQHNITELKNTSPLENPEENPTSNLPSLDIEKTLEQTPTSDPVKTLDQSNCCEPNTKRETKKK